MGCGSSSTATAAPSPEPTQPEEQPKQPEPEDKLMEKGTIQTQTFAAPSNDIPTPLSLYLSQRKHAEAHVDSDDPNSNRQGEPPPPSPPLDRKEDIFQRAKYTDQDDQTVGAPRSLGFKSEEHLVKHLTSEIPSALGKVRALYLWLTTQNLLSYDLQDVPETNSPVYRMLLSRGGLGSLNTILHDWCKLVDIPCQMIHGDIKTGDFYYGEQAIRGHVWCAVHVSGSWRLLDAQLGSRSDPDRNIGDGDILKVSRPNRKRGPRGSPRRSVMGRGVGMETPSPRSVRATPGIETPTPGRSSHLGNHQAADPLTPRRALGGVTSRSMDTTPRDGYVTPTVATTHRMTPGPSTWESTEALTVDDVLREFYFLTDPEALIFSHLADDRRWQLLASPLTGDQFKHMVHLRPAFFHYRLRNVSHAKGLIRVPDDDNAQVVFTPHEGATLQFTYRMDVLKGSLGRAHRQHEGLHQYVFLENFNDLKKLDLTMLSKASYGRYRILISCWDVKDAVKLEMPIAEYFVDTVRPTFDANPYPHGTVALEYGPGASCELLDILPVSHTAAIIRVEEGQAIVTFACDPTQFQFEFSLQSRLSTVIRPQDCLRYQLVPREGLTLFVRVPHGGDYLLRVFARGRDGQRVAMTNVCNYLLVAPKCYPDAMLFPPTDDWVVGWLGADVAAGAAIAEDPTTEDPTGRRVGDDPLPLTPVSHPNAVIQCDDDRAPGRVRLEMSGVPHLGVLVQMQLCAGSRVDDYSDYVWSERTHGSTWVFHARFPRAGHYSLIIYAKVKHKGRLYQPAWKYLITVDRPWVEAMPYPAPHPSWEARYQLLEPTSGYLSERRDITFSVVIPEASAVTVTGGSGPPCNLEMREAETDNDQDGEENGVTKDDADRKSVSLWTGVVPTGKGRQNLTVAAKLNTPDNNNAEWTSMLEYQVLSCSEEKGLVGEGQWSERDAATRRQKQEARLEQQEDTRRQHQLENQGKTEEEMADFTKNKEDYVSEQKNFRKKEIDEYYGISSRSEEEGTARWRDTTSTEKDNIVRQQMIDVKEMSLDENTRKRRLQSGLMVQLARERLREGTRLQDLTLLEPAYRDFIQMGLPEIDGDVTAAARIIDLLKTKQALQTAMVGRDVGQIEAVIERVHRRGHHGPLQTLVQEAHRLLDSLRRLDNLKLTLLGMDKGTMGEIRSYVRPPRAVHSVMTAAFLLLGDDEATTSDWSVCQSQCTTVGPRGLNRRILGLNERDLHPEILARVDQIVSKFTLHDVQRVSAGAATFYVWIHGTLQESRRLQGEQALESAPPADVDRQREIFGRAPIDTGPALVALPSG